MLKHAPPERAPVRTRTRSNSTALSFASDPVSLRRSLSEPDLRRSRSVGGQLYRHPQPWVERWLDADPAGSSERAQEGADMAAASTEGISWGEDSDSDSVTSQRTRSESSATESSNWKDDLVLDMEEETWADELLADGVMYVHGSNSASLEGVARFRALLAVDKIVSTPWFYRNGNKNLPSGEGGYSFIALEKDEADHAGSSKRPDTTGISMYGFHHADLSVRYYAMQGASESVFPLLYGIDNEVPVIPFDDHKVSEESINIDHIRAIYVPVERVDEAKRILLEHGNEALSSRVKGSSIFSRY